MSSETKPFNATPLYVFAALALTAGVGYFVINDIKDRDEKDALKAKAAIARKDEEKTQRINLIAIKLGELARCQTAIQRSVANGTYNSDLSEVFARTQSDALHAVEMARYDIGNEGAEQLRRKIMEINP